MCVQLYRVTGDERFELVVVDYGSEDLDVEGALRSSSLPRYPSPLSLSPPVSLSVQMEGDRAKWRVLSQWRSPGWR